jgi:hypothetical protein
MPKFVRAAYISLSCGVLCTYLIPGAFLMWNSEENKLKANQAFVDYLKAHAHEFPSQTNTLAAAVKSDSQKEASVIIPENK